MILKRKKRARAGIRKEPRIRCPGHLAYVRLHTCAVQGIGCDDKIEAAHVRMGTDGALGIKPSDCYAVPLCTGAHIPLQHRIGEAEFERRYGIDMKALAAQLWQRSPHRLKYERRIIGERANG